MKGFDSLRYIDKKDDRKFDPFLKYAVACGVMAVEDSGLNLERVDKNRFGIPDRQPLYYQPDDWMLRAWWVRPQPD